MLPERDNAEREFTAYVRLFRTLRGLAQETDALSILSVAYRPHINRRNVLPEPADENPMFMSYQENYLGFLSANESHQMVREIGFWKGIEWDDEALDEAYRECGGHPLITRYFASDACDKGKVTRVTKERARETTAAIRRTFYKHRIGSQYRESVWKILDAPERRVIVNAAQGVDGAADGDLQEAAVTVENFGLILRANGRVRVTAALFETWVLQQE